MAQEAQIPTNTVKSNIAIENLPQTNCYMHQNCKMLTIFENFQNASESSDNVSENVKHTFEEYFALIRACMWRSAANS